MAAYWKRMDCTLWTWRSPEGEYPFSRETLCEAHSTSRTFRTSWPLFGASFISKPFNHKALFYLTVRFWLSFHWELCKSKDSNEKRGLYCRHFKLSFSDLSRFTVPFQATLKWLFWIFQTVSLNGKSPDDHRIGQLQKVPLFLCNFSLQAFLSLKLFSVQNLISRSS